MFRHTSALIFALTCTSFAAVKSIEVIERSDVLDSAAFGAAGPYERILAKAHFAIDPKLAPNRIIADIDLAPRNEAGEVEFSAELYILKPRDSAKGNGTAVVEISNRGGKGLLSMFDFASELARLQGSTDPRAQADFGDNFLLEHGFTMVWIGWEFDIPPSPKLLPSGKAISASPQFRSATAHKSRIPSPIRIIPQTKCLCVIR